MIERASDKAEMAAWLDRLYCEKNRPEHHLLRGVTTNPRLTFNAVKDDPDYWRSWIDALIRDRRLRDVEEVFWETYKEIARRGARFFMPVFEASGRRHGYVSVQADPRCRHDAERMVAQGEELRALSPNVMIKIPGTAEGYDAIRRLTARGIPTNNTVSLVISQFIACMDAVCRGLERARADGVDLSGWRSVITVMSSRFGTQGGLQQEASDLGLELSESDVRWAEIALIKRAGRLIERHPRYPGKLLLSSMRVSPVVDGFTRVWHLEKMAGADIIYTLPPPFLESLLFQAPDLEFTDQWAEPVPQPVLDKLQRLPYFERGYRPDGYSPAEFNTHPALVSTAREFSRATRTMVEFIAERVAAAGR
jgi:transaldolase